MVPELGLFSSIVANLIKLNNLPLYPTRFCKYITLFSPVNKSIIEVKINIGENNNIATEDNKMSKNLCIFTFFDLDSCQFQDEKIQE